LSAGVAGGARHTVLNNAVLPANERCIVRLKEDIAGLIKEKEPIVWQKTVVGTD